MGRGRVGRSGDFYSFVVRSHGGSSVSLTTVLGWQERD
jgi:hypothetical protein